MAVKIKWSPPPPCVLLWTPWRGGGIKKIGQETVILLNMWITLEFKTESGCYQKWLLRCCSAKNKMATMVAGPNQIIGRFQGKLSMMETAVSVRLLFPGRYFSVPMIWKKVHSGFFFFFALEMFWERSKCDGKHHGTPRSHNGIDCIKSVAFAEGRNKAELTHRKNH